MIRHAEAVRHSRRQTARLPSPDRYIGPLRAIGPVAVGAAAWYGGRHVGERTASGERLDTIHATAAHRWLPLHSLVRVTNLRNGRSAIATINDRGPVSRSLLIDLSPRVAKELDMMRAGIAHVSIVPVAAIQR
jgi:rare lipoprotein A